MASSYCIIGLLFCGGETSPSSSGGFILSTPGLDLGSFAGGSRTTCRLDERLVLCGDCMVEFEGLPELICRSEVSAGHSREGEGSLISFLT